MAILDHQVRYGSKLGLLCLLLMVEPVLQAQVNQKTAPLVAPVEAPKDTLGRSTPRGSVLGFLSATRKGNAEIAALYLNTPLRGREAAILAGQLGTVLDRRLPARISQ